MSQIEVYQTTSRTIQVNKSGRQLTFAFNPETAYVLVPASIYGADPEVVNALRNSDIIEGVFNHNAISEV